MRNSDSDSDSYYSISSSRSILLDPDYEPSSYSENNDSDDLYNNEIHNSDDDSDRAGDHNSDPNHDSDNNSDDPNLLDPNFINRFTNLNVNVSDDDRIIETLEFAKSMEVEDDLPLSSEDDDEDRLSYFQVKEMNREEVMKAIEEFWEMIYRDESGKFKFKLRNSIFKEFRVGTKKGNRIRMVLDHVHSYCKMGRHFSKRALYYTYIESFASQKMSDEILNDVSCLIGCTRASLWVQAANRGAVAGNLMYDDGVKFIDCTKCDMHGYNIPQVGLVTRMTTNALFILLVEKDSVFVRLVEDRFFDRFRCIIITGKGYPDVATRVFLRKLKMEFNLPVLALMDFDPYGVNIMTVYKFGSQNMAYDSKNLITPNIKWIGIRQSDISAYNIPEQCMQEMSEEEKKFGINLAKEDFMDGDWDTELMFMIQNQKKVEIEALDRLGHNFLMETYLPNKLTTCDWI